MTKSLIPLVDLSAQYRSIKHEIDSGIQKVLDSSEFILGDVTAEFESAFAASSGARFGIGVSNGLDALRLVLEALHVGPGDEVILPANTFIATALAVSAVGANPVLVDCERSTYNIDPARIERNISARTRAIIVVHFAGSAACMDEIMGIAGRHSLFVIEDAAQAHGATYNHRPVGSHGLAGCFSFYPSKNLGAYGDGGMVITSDARIARQLCALRNYGKSGDGGHTVLGHNARLDNIQAAILNVKLPHLNDWNKARRHNATLYKGWLTGVGDLSFQTCNSRSSHVYHLFIVETYLRDELRMHLARSGISTGIHYPIPIYREAAYRTLDYRPLDFPNTEYLCNRILSLPMYPELSEAQISRISESIKRFF